MYLSLSGFRILVFLFILLTLNLLSSCCIQDGESDNRQLQYELYEEIAQLKQQNVTLEVEKEEIEKRLKVHEQFVSKLQMGLLKKHARINELLIKNKKLISEFIRYNEELMNKDSKVETVRLLAEAATIVETAKGRNSGKESEKVIMTAEQYLNESTNELKASNFEGASYLAYQAIDIVRTLGGKEEIAGEDGNEEEVAFILHLPMKVLCESNVREKPTIKSKILFVEKSGSIVNAIGFMGHWVKVEGGDYGTGWIHYSLLTDLLN